MGGGAPPPRPNAVPSDDYRCVCVCACVVVTNSMSPSTINWVICLNVPTRSPRMSIGVCVCVCVCVRVYVCVCVCVYLSRAEYVCDTTRRTIGVSCVCVCVCVTNSMSWQHDSRP